MYFEFLSPLAK